MEIIIKDKNGQRHKFNAAVVEIVGKDDDHYRLQQDYQRGIEVTGNGFSSKLYIEPRCANQVTIINKELGEYKVKYTQETLEKHLKSMNSKDDERLRKTTIAFLKDYADQGYENAVECIDWIERQGGEKDSLSIDFVLGYLGIKPAYKDGNAWCILLGDNIQEGICGFGDTKEEALIAFMKELIEKQGKQKASYTDIVKTGDGGINALVTRELPTDGEQKTEENRGNVGGIFPNWSEEDDNCLSTIIAEFSKCSGKSVSKDEWMRCNDFLNSLKDRVQPQPKQEWSKEDEKTLNEIFSVAARASLRENTTLFGKSYDYIKWQNWLKSLRPQTKKE